MSSANISTDRQKDRGGTFPVLLCLIVVLACMFHKSFEPGQTLFNNDGPLGVQKSDWLSMPEGFQGWWIDLQWLGYPGGTASITATWILKSFLNPIYFSKFLAPVSLLLLGLSSWVFCRQTGFSRGVSMITSLAVMLNMNTVSHVGWGLASRATCMAAVFLALAALAGVSRGKTRVVVVLRLALTGFATGLGVMEGFDIGAIYSLYIAALTFYLPLMTAPSRQLPRRLGFGIIHTVIVAVCAGFLAFQAMSYLVPTFVKGTGGVAPAEQFTAEQKWDFATTWSLPKIEAVRLLVPGLFGYGAKNPGDAQYWGTVGRQPGWEQHHQGAPRYSGAGEYAGLLVMLIASWAFIFSLQTKEGLFSDFERKVIWFWTAASFVSLLFAFGRHAVFYRFIYALPFFSTIRNPLKFMHPFHLGLLILFAYGLQGLSRRYLEGAIGKTKSLTESLKQWWAGAAGPEKKWTVGAGVFLIVSLVAGMVYSSSDRELLQYLQANGLGEPAAGIIKFSKTELGIYLFFLVVSIGILLAVFSGFFRGRPRWALILLGLILIIDLLRADVPWIIYYDYQQQYASNIVVDRLREKPHEARVAEVQHMGITVGANANVFFGSLMQSYQKDQRWLQQFQWMSQYYDGQWLQQLFPYYNIQSLDMAQDPRKADEKAAYNQALGGNVGRIWELTNTRYLIGISDTTFVELLNQVFDSGKRRFRLDTPFELYKEGQNSPDLARLNPSGPFALIEFTGALPRAAMYSHWQISTNPAETLKTLANPEFNPHETVIVDGQGPAPTSQTNAPGSVEFISYAPKRIHLKAKASISSILLLNDRYDPDWTVLVDGKPDKVLRCNYLMRGVTLSPGEHAVEFRFEPKLEPRNVSLATFVLGFVLLGVVYASERRNSSNALQSAKAVAESVSTATAVRKKTKK